MKARIIRLPFHSARHLHAHGKEKHTRLGNFVSERGKKKKKKEEDVTPAYTANVSHLTFI